jgi:hypothetical protein
MKVQPSQLPKIVGLWGASCKRRAPFLYAEFIGSWLTVFYQALKELV